MKNQIQIFTLVFFLFYYLPLNAQFTKGGTYKNYEKYHVSYDTIKTTRTISSPAGQMERVGYFFFNVGPALPISKPFTSEPNTSTSISSDYAGAGSLGGSTGVDIGLGGMYGIPGINKHLIRQLDLAVYQSLNFTYLPWTYKALGSPFTDYDYNGFMAISTCIAPAIIINPVLDLDLHVDVAYRLGISATFGGGIEYTGTSMIERGDVGLNFYHGPSINFRYSLLLVGFELAMLGDYGTMYFSGSGGIYTNCAVPLNNFSIKLGLKL